MVTPQTFLSELGFNAKEVDVYLTLLQQGPSSVRQLATSSGVNRGTTYDILKSLQEKGIVSFYEEEKKSLFVAENPTKLQKIIDDQKEKLQSLKKEFEEVAPQLSSLAVNGDHAKPVARYYKGPKGIKSILEEVLIDVAEMKEKEYLVYSSSLIAEHLYTAIPDFTKRRIENEIFVRVITLGNGGSNGEALSKRKWLTKDEPGPTYTIVFGHNSASISLDEQGQLHGVVISDKNLAKTNRMLFNAHWESLT